MRAGEKNRRVRIEVLSVTKSTFGSETETWYLLSQVWAKVTFRTIKKAETVSAMEITSEQYVEFKLDYIAGLSPKLNRVIYDGQIYDIWEIQQFGYREASLLTCRLQHVAGVGTGISGSTQAATPAVPDVTTRMMTIYRDAPGNNTTPIISYSEYPFTINGINNLKVASGSITVKFQKNGVDITGMTGIAVTTSAQTVTATAGNAVAVGDRVTMVCTNNSSAAGLEGTMKGTI